MVGITEIYGHWFAGRSQSESAVSLGWDRKTIRKYLTPAEASGTALGEQSDDPLVEETEG
ncbi:hypothetical protein [Streptomyces rishiriensis]|uniref:Transcriptional regulator n=1 Tax=Streptomyces rishiriensis TaxID=68264 RepID=A0ABU0NHG3_STRRH|nr:hypothetical protein [Streptomyces rishiriensis]MDQ0578516.1 putative transcriptional regulator [Streptomyces rishiriensis]